MKQGEKNEGLTKINEIAQTQQEMLKIQNIMLQKQEKMETRQDNIEEKQDIMKKEQEEMKNKQETMEEKQDRMQKELTRIGNIVAKIEYEHGKKLDLILDILTGHQEKLQQHEKRFEKDETIIEMHGHKIYAIEQNMKQ